MVSRTRGSKGRQPVKSKHFAFDGGLNLVDPPLSTPDGMLLGVSNFELRVRGGYRRIDGIERFDGNLLPSEASYWMLDFDAGDIAEPPIGSGIHGDASGANGEVGSMILTSGTWAGGDAAGHFILFNVTGTFQDNETIHFTGVGDGFNHGFSNGIG